MSAIIALAYLSLLTLGLMENVRGPFYPELVRDLGLNATAGSAYFAVVSLFAFAGGLYCRRLIRGRSSLTVLALLSVIFGVGFAGFALARDYFVLLGFCVFYGVAYGALNVLQNILVTENSPPAKRRRFLNGLQSMYGLAALLAPLTASVLRTLEMGWRSAFLVLSVLPLMTALGVAIWAGQRGSTRLSPISADVPPPESRWDVSRWMSVAAFALLFALYLWGEISISTRLVLWLRDVHQFSPRQAEAQLALFFALIWGVRTLLAFVDLRRLGNWPILCFCGLASAGIYGAGLGASPYLVAWAGLTMAPFFPLIMDQAALFFAADSARALGWIIALGNLFVMGMHLALGAMSDHWGLSTALLTGPLALLLIGVGLGVRLLPWRRQLTP